MGMVIDPAVSIVDAPNPNDDFAVYEAQRVAALTAATQQADPDDVVGELADETPATPAAEPEPAASETAPPAEAEKTPEPGSESGPDDSTQEQTERGSKQGVPQKRFDEVVKARRDAEGKAATLEAENAALKAQIEAGKKAPAETAPLETKPPVEAAPSAAPAPVEEFKVAEPDPNDEKYALGNYDPQYIKDVADWQYDKRDFDRAQKVKADEAAALAVKEAARKKTEQDRSEADRAAFKQKMAASIEKSVAAYPDFNEVIKSEVASVPFSDALRTAIDDSDDPSGVAYRLGKDPEFFRGLVGQTQLTEDMTPSQVRAAYRTAQRAIDKISESLASTTSAPAPAAASPATVPAAAAPALPATGAPKPPDNTKPAVSRAPAPPAQVKPSSAPPPNDPATAGSLEEYEKARPFVRPRR